MTAPMCRHWAPSLFPGQVQEKFRAKRANSEEPRGPFVIATGLSRRLTVNRFESVMHKTFHSSLVSGPS